MKGAVTERKKFTQTLQDMLDKATDEEDVKYIFPFNTTIH
jgi:CRISPR/Cas system CSM-associated protein Csm2 small subunit